MEPRKHLITVTKIVAAGAAAISLAACGSGGGSSSAPATSTPSAIVQAEHEHTPVDPAIVAADNAFGLRLLQTLLPASSGKNIAISPLSAALALQILYNGAGGATQSAMSQALGLGAMSVQTLNGDNAALQASLIDVDPKVQLTVANSLWFDMSSVLPAFTQINQTYYQAALGDIAGAPDNVNSWVDSETHGLITTLMPPGTYQGAIVANVLYFKGEWSSAFDPSNTVVAPFTLSNGSAVSAPLMHQTWTYPYAAGTLNGSNYQALRVPYGQERLGMILLMPERGTDIDALLAALTIKDVSAVIAQLEPAIIHLGVPRFSASFGASLIPALSTMGMSAAGGSSADYSNLAPGFQLNVIEHKTVIEVDETGTVAAAATGGGDTTSVPPTYTVTLDHPFLYAIQDQETGAILFLGVLENPLQSTGN